MPRAKRNIIVRRGGEVITDTTEARTFTVRRPKPRTWCMTKMTRNDKRINIPAPERDDLTKNQWEEWGDSLRALRLNGYENAEVLSLADMRDTIQSIHMLTNLRVFAQVRG